jgi:hypothetical protein
MMKVRNLYKHKNPEFHRKLGFGILIKEVNENHWIIKWINSGRVVPMHPNWLEAVDEGR